MWKKWQKILMSHWNWLQSKWIYWLLSDERKTSLMSIKDATMHEKRAMDRTTYQISLKSAQTGQFFLQSTTFLRWVDRHLTSRCTLIRIRVNNDSPFPLLFGTVTFRKVVGVKHTTVKNLKWRRKILFSGHAVHGRRHTGESCHIHWWRNLI